MPERRCPECYKIIVIKGKRGNYVAEHPKCNFKSEGEFKKDIKVYQYSHTRTMSIRNCGDIDDDARIFILDGKPDLVHDINAPIWNDPILCLL